MFGPQEACREDNEHHLLEQAESRPGTGVQPARDKGTTFLTAKLLPSLRRTPVPWP